MHYIKRIGLSLILLSAVLAGLRGSIFGSIQPSAAQAYELPYETWLPSEVAGQANLFSPTMFQTQPIILLTPFSGSEGTPVTVSGQGWVAGDQVIVYLVAEGQEFALANSMADESGQFVVSFLTPSNWTDNNVFTIVARTVSGDVEAQSLFIYVEEGVPGNAPQAVVTTPGGVVTTDRLNVRSGPGSEYPAIGKVSLNQEVEISGKNNGWWRISYLYAAGDYGWVFGLYIDADDIENVPFIETAAPAPTPTATQAPTPTPQPAYQCNPGQWSGCSPSFCPAEYVSQCGDDGTWGECVWDPGSCSTYSSDDDDDDDDNDHPPIINPPLPAPLPTPVPTPAGQPVPQPNQPAVPQPNNP
jgi:hypothetical protein